MLTQFTVKNCRQFKEQLIFDLSANNYAFNLDCINKNIVKTALVYGHNGSGKSCLGLVMFDIVEHLTNNNASGLNEGVFLNALSSENYAIFTYKFLFEGVAVTYRYHKDSQRKLLKETLLFDDDIIVDYQKGLPFTVNLKGAENLNTKINEGSNLSALRYIYSNTNLDKSNTHNKVFHRMMTFVSQMLWFRGLLEGFDYIGLKSGSDNISQRIIEKDNLKDFENFLNDSEIDCQLSTTESDGKETIAFKMGNKNIPFFSIASTGTQSLTLFYYWWQEVSQYDATLIFIDEFDAFYHFGVSKAIVERLKTLNAQTLLTTHNTALLSNDLIRPDCGFIIDGKRIKSLHNSTQKELRFAHNLEKLYRAGGFSG